MSESDAPTPSEEAMLDLLVKQVTEGLSPEEQRTLDAMDRALTSAYAEDFERAAAAISLAANVSSSELLSPMLRSRIEQEAQAFFANTTATALRSPKELAPVGRSSSRISAVGWYAAAACLLLAAFGWLRSPQPITAPPTANIPITVPPLRCLRRQHPPLQLRLRSARRCWRCPDR